MSANELENLKNNIGIFRYNPTEIQRHVLRMIPEISGGELTVVDPSNPFVFAIEAAATMAASIMAENSANNRKHYGTTAVSKSELYRHMADSDLLDINALPATAPFFFAFSLEELQETMVPVAGTEIRKLVIPRNTTVTISGITFSLQYPIEIRQMGHGGIQVVWDTEKKSPLLNIETNIIDNAFMRTPAGVEMLVFSVPMQQMSIVSLVETISGGRKFSLTAAISDKYYHTRVWSERTDGVWVELPITYSQEIYSVSRPTAIVLVNGNEVTVELPIVYTRNGSLSGKIRCDIYQTRGPLSMDLSNYNPTEFVANWLAIDKADKNQFVAPLANFKTLMVYSTSVFSGGRNEMTFEQLRSRVIENSFGHPLLPITPAQVQSRLERKGYNIVKNIDNLTDRVFKATRAMPVPQDTQLITAASAGIHTITSNSKLLATVRSVRENFESITILPDTLYALDNGRVRIVSSAELDAINSLPGDKKAQLITEGSYFFSPFHYVLDSSDDRFNVRAYYLDAPEIKSRTFIAENDTTGLQVSIGNYLVQRSEQGWELYVTTVSSQQWKSIMPERRFATIGYSPDRTGELSYIRGEIVGQASSGEDVWCFKINTNYKVDLNDEITITNSSMFENTQQEHRASLFEEFDLFFSTVEAMPAGWLASDFDTLIGQHLVDYGSVGVTRERLGITLGYSLNALWSMGRSVVGQENYLKYDANVPAVWENDVYKLDPITGVAKFEVVNGEIVFELMHKAGDPVLDGAGNPVYRHLKGDVMLDSYGKPIVADHRQLERQFDVFLLEAPYLLATNEVSSRYMRTLVGALVNWITVDLQEINRSLLDKTRIYFTPIQNVGQVDVVYGAGLQTTINAGQYFRLKLYVSDTVYKNTELKEKIRQVSITSLAESLQNRTVSTSGIVENLKKVYQDDVISFEVEGLGGANKLAICTMVDDSTRLTLRKRLVYRADQTFAVEEDVSVEFIAHERGVISAI